MNRYTQNNNFHGFSIFASSLSISSSSSGKYCFKNVSFWSKILLSFSSSSPFSKSSLKYFVTNKFIEFLNICFRYSNYRYSSTIPIICTIVFRIVRLVWDVLASLFWKKPFIVDSILALSKDSNLSRIFFRWIYMVVTQISLSSSSSGFFIWLSNFWRSVRQLCTRQRCFAEIFLFFIFSYFLAWASKISYLVLLL